MIFEEDEENSISEELQEEVEEEISFSELNFIRNSIENMTKFNQIEVLRLLHGNKTIILNENLGFINQYNVKVNHPDKNILKGGLKRCKKGSRRNKKTRRCNKNKTKKLKHKIEKN